MATFNIVNMDRVMSQVKKRTEKAVRLIPKMLSAGAAVLVEAQKNEAQQMGLIETGDFINSIKASKIKNKNGMQYIEVEPTGVGSNGVRNAMKGAVAEYGKSNQPARPWMTAANEKCYTKTVLEMQRVYNEDEEDD